MTAPDWDIRGKRCLVTGGTAGIGLVTAKRLAGLGAQMVLVGRDPARGAAAVAKIRSATGANGHHFLAADLSDQAEIRTLANDIRERYERIDVLINNAGAMFGTRQESRQGIEMTFALNHLGYFLLTLLLLPSVQAAAPARIINVASDAHRGVILDFDNLQARRDYGGWSAYKRSKLANLLFTHELARRVDWQRVTVNALHPGFVATEIGVSHGLLPSILWRLAKLAAISVEEGAETPVYLATAGEVSGVHGRYFRKGQPADTSAAAHDRQAAERLWQESVRLTGLTPEQVPAVIR